MLRTECFNSTWLKKPQARASTSKISIPLRPGLKRMQLLSKQKASGWSRGVKSFSGNKAQRCVSSCRTCGDINRGWFALHGAATSKQVRFVFEKGIQENKTPEPSQCVLQLPVGHSVCLASGLAGCTSLLHKYCTSGAWWKPTLRSGTTALWRASLSTVWINRTYKLSVCVEKRL